MQPTQTSGTNQETAPASASLATSASTTESSNLLATAPGQLRVIKRNGTVVTFNKDKIMIAITKAFLAVEGQSGAASARIREKVEALADQIVNIFKRRMPSGGTMHIEEIQDQAELALMRSGEHQIARSYVLYREAQKQKRNADLPQTTAPEVSLSVTLANGEREALDVSRLQTVISESCAELEEVDAQKILDDTLQNLYDGVAEQELNTSMVITARTLIEQEPNYTYVTARLLLDTLRAEALSFLDVTDRATHGEMTALYPVALENFINKGIALEILNPELATYDMKKLGAAINADRDMQFTYLSLQTLYDRYFIHSSEEVRYELPQIFFMRVAMGLAIAEDTANGHREERAIEFYNLLSSFDYMSSTPTLFNAGTLRPQLSSCYLTTVPDDLHGIYGAIQDNAMLSKWAGGLGNDWTPVRSLGAYIKGTNGKSQGVVPFLKVVNDTAVAVNQGGKRKGAVCAYLETWHSDIEEFLDLRKNTGDDRRRTHDMNTANWIPDLFMKRVLNDEPWTLFSPNEVPDLHDLYGKAFEERYTHYEQLAAQGGIKLHKKIEAKELWRKILSMLFETGHPWITFKDPCNIRSPQQHTGVVHSSNLCTEITLNTNKDEIAVCNLGSVNLAQHTNENGLDVEKIKRTVKTAIRMLDNVIDINFYSVPQAKNSNMQHRPIGMGIMGFQDALHAQKLAYASPEAVQFADESMETISYHAIEASSELAKERGSYQTFDGSLWSQGILPIDSVRLLKEERGNDFCQQDESQRLDWDALRNKVKSQGMRNSNVMAIAPTATIGNITGVTASIEPTYKNLYVKSNLSGEFTVVNPHLIRELKERDLWDQVMVNDLKYFDGSLQQIDRIPDDIKNRFRDAFEVEPRWIVEAASRRQKWIDQAQSLNLYIAEANGKKLDVTYKMAWLSGLKTTYYLRAIGATTAEKSTISDTRLNKVSNTAAVAQPETSFAQAADVPQACSLDDPECEACQ